MILGNELIIPDSEELEITSKTSDLESDNDIDVNYLITQCRTDKNSLEILYNTFKKDVFAIAFSILSDFHLSEDCVAETFVRLTQVKRFSSSKGNGKGFIIKIARNCAMEMYRRYKKERYSEVIQAYGQAEKSVEDSIYINQLLKHLPDKYRQIVVMKCCSELTFKEIARIIHTPESTVKSRYKRAMDILRKKAGE
ncbi:MAG: RNA polymerase sigma factor [Oscillospiraceae bacterium]|nr:RNA polymerase sigma factor [Oscillospiraceae bacterium]